MDKYIDVAKVGVITALNFSHTLRLRAALPVNLLTLVVL